MDKVLSWYQNLSGDVFLDYEGNLDIKAISCGSIPQRFGITKLCDVEKFYLRR